MKVYRSALAIQDIWETSVWLAEAEDAELALKFVDSIEKTVADLIAQPFLGPIVGELKGKLAGMRFWRVNGFRNHLIFYKTESDRIVIVRVLHGARNLDELL